MPFKKGNTANLTGRPKNVVTPNAAPEEQPKGNKLQTSIQKFLEKNMIKILEDLETPAAREKARIYCHLLNYTVPKLSRQSGEIKFEEMSEEQLSALLAMLQKNAMPGSNKQVTYLGSSKR
jgi:hypothetical protein